MPLCQLHCSVQRLEVTFRLPIMCRKGSSAVLSSFLLYVQLSLELLSVDYATVVLPIHEQNTRKYGQSSKRTYGFGIFQRRVDWSIDQCRRNDRAEVSFD